jgi:hypothetical protein
MTPPKQMRVKMKNSIITRLLLVGLICSFCHSCTKTTTAALLTRYSGKPYIQEWIGNYIQIKAIAVTPAYERLLELSRAGVKKIEQQTLDSLEVDQNVNSDLTFKLYLYPTEEFTDTVYFHNSDILLGYGRNREERRQAMEQFNFGLTSRIWARIAGEKISPALCHCEENYGLDNGRNLWIVFKLNDRQRQTARAKRRIELYFDNPLTNEGLSTFVWSGAIIAKLVDKHEKI